MGDETDLVVSTYFDNVFEDCEEYKKHEKDITESEKARLEEIEKALSDPNLDKEVAAKLLEEKEKSAEVIRRQETYLKSIAIIENGISIAMEMIDDNMPELADRFSKASIDDKVEYLLEKYSQEYRTELDGNLRNIAEQYHEAIGRGSAEDWIERLGAMFTPEAVQSADAKAYAFKQIDVYFPRLLREYQSKNRDDLSALAEHAAIPVYEQLVKEYASHFVAGTGSNLMASLRDHISVAICKNEHEQKKPDLLSNIRSFGELSQKWESERADLAVQFNLGFDKIRQSEYVRSQVIEQGISSPAAIEAGKETVKSLHPEVVQGRDKFMALQWAAKRSEQVAARKSNENRIDEDRQVSERSDELSR